MYVFFFFGYPPISRKVVWSWGVSSPFFQVLLLPLSPSDTRHQWSSFSTEVGSRLFLLLMVRYVTRFTRGNYVSVTSTSVNTFKWHLKVTKVLLLPLVPKGGSMEPPLRKPLSHQNFAMKLHHTCTGHNKITILQKKKNKCYTVSKWRPNNRFLFRVILILAKFWKITFPKEFFNEIWLKEGEYK